METPEQPTIWPPPPTLPPPEAEQPKPFKMRLPLPEWLNYWLNTGVGVFAVRYIIRGFCEVDRLPVPGWTTDKAVFIVWFVLGGVATAWKFRPRKKE